MKQNRRKSCRDVSKKALPGMLGYPSSVIKFAHLVIKARILCNIQLNVWLIYAILGLGPLLDFVVLQFARYLGPGCTAPWTPRGSTAVALSGSAMALLSETAGPVPFQETLHSAHREAAKAEARPDPLHGPRPPPLHAGTRNRRAPHNAAAASTGTPRPEPSRPSPRPLWLWPRP